MREGRVCESRMVGSERGIDMCGWYVTVTMGSGRGVDSE